MKSKAKLVKPEIEILALQQNDTTLWLKIKNVSEKDIFVPGNYVAAFPTGADTIHLEAFGDPEINRSVFYRYSDLLPQPFYSTVIIPGLKIDTIVTKEYDIAYNQFGVGEFIRLKKDSVYTLQDFFDIPCYAKVANVVYYSIPFSEVLKPGYTLPDFSKFNRDYGKHVSSVIYKTYQ